jgi:hypothetical protein
MTELPLHAKIAIQEDSYMKNFFKYFGGSIIFAFVCLGLSVWVGFSFGGTLEAAMAAMFTTLMLAILETSLSFDNAVVNAKILVNMNPFWRRMFLTIGIIIAVFGVRLILPFVIVWLVGGQSFPATVAMTWTNPAEFQRILVNQHVLVAGFGGAFLWMVFTKFFFDQEKEVHWIALVEKRLSAVGRMDALWVAVTMVISLVFYFLMPEHGRTEFLMASMMGVITYILIDGLSGLLAEGEAKAVKGAATGGIGMFMYLEILDASFSFDGVIGGFAITDNIFILTLGLGIGAMFVRSITIKMVDSGTLDNYIYLEHGAFWAIGALSAIMYLSVIGVEVPEVVSGLIGVVFIGLSFLSSILHRKKKAAT